MSVLDPYLVTAAIATSKPLRVSGMNTAEGISGWEWIALCVVVSGTIFFIAWLRRRHDTSSIQEELQQARELACNLERERDLAQKEVFRRLYEERELNKEKTQFQAQLAEYEKYAALARLALGAAHEINNPLLGILSHLELELNVTTDPEQQLEIEQCIAGAKRISNT